MAELKLKILADLSKLRSDIQNFLKNKFKIGLEDKLGLGTDGGKKEGGAGVGGILTGILKALGPIALLLSLKPIMDLLKLAVNLLLYGVFKILRPIYEQVLKPMWALLKPVLTKLFGQREEPVTALDKEVKDDLEKMADEIPAGIDESSAKALLQAVKLQDIMKKAGLDTENGLIQNANIIRGALEAQGIDTKEFTDKFLLSLADNATENKAALDIISGNITDLDEAIGGVSAPIKMAVEKEIEKLSNKLAELNETSKKDINKKAEEVSNNEIKVLEDIATEIDKQTLSFGDLLSNFFRSMIDVLKDIFEPIVGFFKFLNVDDAIIKPGGQVIKTHPQDTLIATKNPEAIGGGRNISLTFNGVTPQEMIDTIKRELGVDVFRSSRF